MTGLYHEIYKTVKKIPTGRVSTYGQIALLTGNPRRSRIVGCAMACCKDKSVPCHRVIYSNGRLVEGFGIAGLDLQKAMLIEEGVEVLENNTVDLGRYAWDGNL